MKYVYISIAYSASKKAYFHYFFADTLCSCIEGVDKLFQDAMGYNCIEHDINSIAVCVYITMVYSTLKKGDFHYFSYRYHLQLHLSF